MRKKLCMFCDPSEIFRSRVSQSKLVKCERCQPCWLKGLSWNIETIVTPDLKFLKIVLKLFTFSHFSTVVSCTVLNCTLLYCTVVCCTVFYCTVLYHMVFVWPNLIVLLGLLNTICSSEIGAYGFDLSNIF